MRARAERWGDVLLPHATAWQGHLTRVRRMRSTKQARRIAHHVADNWIVLAWRWGVSERRNKMERSSGGTAGGTGGAGHDKKQQEGGIKLRSNYATFTGSVESTASMSGLARSDV